MHSPPTHTSRDAEFFTDSNFCTGPAVTDAMLKQAEADIGGYKLPARYVQLLRHRNGGVPRRQRCPTSRPTLGWASDHIKIDAILGVGFDRGLNPPDGTGSIYLIREWGYPPIGVVFCSTPAGGHDAVMLDYSKCGQRGEPAVVYVDEDRSLILLAENFESFLALLRSSERATPDGS